LGPASTQTNLERSAVRTIEIARGNLRSEPLADEDQELATTSCGEPVEKALDHFRLDDRLFFFGASAVDGAVANTTSATG